MKKSFLLLFVLIFFGASARAQVCKISGTNNDNIEVFTCFPDVSRNQVIVRVSNDSRDISANVTVEVEVQNAKSGSSLKKLTITGKGLAKPNGPTDIRIDLPSGFELVKESSVECKGISGAKCQ